MCLAIGALLGPALSHATNLTADELRALGRHEEAKAADAKTPAAEEKYPSEKEDGQEQRDGGDAPLEPGCACLYDIPGCGLPITGIAVDECFPGDGVTLQEKTIPNACGNYANKEYDCKVLLGNGAQCRLVDLTCCGVKTTSGFCFINSQE